MKKFCKFTFFGLLLGAAAAQAQNPANGKALFIKQQCARCHGPKDRAAPALVSHPIRLRWQ